MIKLIPLRSLFFAVLTTLLSQSPANAQGNILQDVFRGLGELQQRQIDHDCRARSTRVCSVQRVFGGGDYRCSDRFTYEVVLNILDCYGRVIGSSYIMRDVCHETAQRTAQESQNCR
jgi:hypothetical protein